MGYWHVMTVYRVGSCLDFHTRFFMNNELMAKEIEINPMGVASTFSTTEYISVELACDGYIMNWHCQMKWLKHDVHCNWVKSVNGGRELAIIWQTGEVGTMALFSGGENGLHVCQIELRLFYAIFESKWFVNGSTDIFAMQRVDTVITVTA